MANYYAMFLHIFAEHNLEQFAFEIFPQSQLFCDYRRDLCVQCTCKHFEDNFRHFSSGIHFHDYYIKMLKWTFSLFTEIKIKIVFNLNQGFFSNKKNRLCCQFNTFTLFKTN